MARYLLPNIKLYRNRVILKEIQIKSIQGAYMISCGNAYKSLKDLSKGYGMSLIGLSTTQPYPESIQLESRYYSKEDLAKLYPLFFNATSGALPIKMMWDIGWEIYQRLINQSYHNETLYVPVGSGETIVSLGMVNTRDNLRGYTCDSYPPLKTDYTYLEDELKKFDIVKINALEEVEKFDTSESSVLVTW